MREHWRLRRLRPRNNKKNHSQQKKRQPRIENGGQASCVTPPVQSPSPNDSSVGQTGAPDGDAETHSCHKPVPVPSRNRTPGVLLLIGILGQTTEGVRCAIACAQLDPFDVFPERLTSQHQMLLHHCEFTSIQKAFSASI
jgi:hypothetical protein